MQHSRMLAKWHVLGAPLCKGQLPSRHIENILKLPKRTFSNMPYGQYSRNWFVMDLSHDKPYIYISSLILYKNLLFPAMYSRLEWAPSSDQIVPPISVIRVWHGLWSLYWWLIDCWLSYCIVSKGDCEPRGLYPNSLQPIESVLWNFNKHSWVDFLPKDKWSDLLWNKWIHPPPLELWLRKRLVCICVRCFCIAHCSSRSCFSVVLMAMIDSRWSKYR